MRALLVPSRPRRTCGSAGLVLLIAWLLPLLPLGVAARSARAEDGITASSDSEEEEEEEEENDLRQRLTEREDQRRHAKPFHVDIGGRPLTISGEYEIGFEYLRGRLEEDDEDEDQLLLGQQLEVEAFYSFGEILSVFAQVRGEMAEDLLPNRFDEVSEAFIERGEMWLYSEDIAGSGVSVDVGRLDFEDDRRWWWDDELDAVRAEYEGDAVDVALALAQEIGPTRTDRSFVEAEREGVFRVLGEGSWEWRPNHAFELFLVYQDDHSPRERPDEAVRLEEEDESDARLTWLGARLLGVHPLEGGGILGYWLDTGFVWGEERFAEIEELSRHRGVVEEVLERDVFGWAVDLGASWILPAPFEPRLFAGYAVGSGDSTPEEGSHRSFRQTGLEENEAGFGGVERFASYGVLLDPELSNLQVLTVGAGLSLLRSSSLDLVYHYYRQVEPAPFLRDAGIDLPLTGRHRDLGHELDLVLALEEWERLELELVGSVFRAGRAFGDERGKWSSGAAFVLRVAF